MKQAINATPISNNATPANVSGSVAVTSNNKLFTTHDNANVDVSSSLTACLQVCRGGIGYSRVYSAYGEQQDCAAQFADKLACVAQNGVRE
jgi:hypothetical protein